MNTPSYIATALRVSGWEQISEQNWQRPGAHPDVHSWPVADLIRRTDEPHHVPPPAVAPKPPKKGFQMRGSNRPTRARPSLVAPYATRRAGQPRKVDLIRRVVSLREQGKTFAAIAAEVGGRPSRIHYLAAQANKLQTVTIH